MIIFGFGGDFFWIFAFAHTNFFLLLTFKGCA